MSTKRERVMHTHALFGHEGTVCGSGRSRPAFITSRLDEVTCPRCLKKLPPRCRACGGDEARRSPHTCKEACKACDGYGIVECASCEGTACDGEHEAGCMGGCGTCGECTTGDIKCEACDGKGRVAP